jgi:hypothetical protein
MVNAPEPAARKVLAKAGLGKDDIDLWEINEAFAIVTEKFIRDLGLDRAKVDVNGGSIALGHPIGATGAILIGTILDELERRSARYGLVTMCAARGKQRGKVTRLWGEQRRKGPTPFHDPHSSRLCWRGGIWDGDGGHDWPDQAGVFCWQAADPGDFTVAEDFSQGDPQGHSGARDRVFVCASEAGAAPSGFFC